MMNIIKKPVAGFILLFSLFHIILLMMRSEHQVFWHLYTGMMLFASISYIYYERNIESKRLLDSVITGILASFVIVTLHTLLSFILKDIHYFNVLKEAVRLGVYVKWQLMITLVISIPIQELMFRTLLQNTTDERFNRYLSGCIVSIAVTSLFMHVLSIQILVFIFIVQFVLALSYSHTKRLITPLTGSVLSIILLMLIYQ
ncbi:type II CAAX prenyl endopeptidase Rce1 family protein [Macrococcoides caseolyticum]|uniref:CPBP family glutamic-type intramembrane protease n=1 Tax=Macrococcoides caseolyticum TaxID=69966 RepID=UPI001F42C5DF|nr:CPBP family glutamic-type intramembrane protease [Macrococcus caseolyticus]MCE4955699.1 CPBP family intramembrane metalloprotease [Macrococcus caseolyticus]